MNTAVLVSIHGEYTGKIFAGMKSLEIRKNAPKITPPFKCYVYETGNGVVGEFTCPAIEQISPIVWTNGRPPMYPIEDEFLNNCCLSYQELADYMRGRTIHAWKILAPVKYDKPKKVTDFALAGICRYNKKGGKCVYNLHCARAGWPNDGHGHERCGRWLDRAPQSWCYVEEQKEAPLNAL